LLRFGTVGNERYEQRDRSGFRRPGMPGFALPRIKRAAADRDN
jgi:hypothetical protein